MAEEAEQLEFDSEATFVNPTAQKAALLNELALAKLEAGKVQEAQELFRQAALANWPASHAAQKQQAAAAAVPTRAGPHSALSSSARAAVTAAVAAAEEDDDDMRSVAALGGLELETDALLHSVGEALKAGAASTGPTVKAPSPSPPPTSAAPGQQPATAAASGGSGSGAVSGHTPAAPAASAAAADVVPDDWESAEPDDYTSMLANLSVSESKQQQRKQQQARDSSSRGPSNGSVSRAAAGSEREWVSQVMEGGGSWRGATGSKGSAGNQESRGNGRYDTNGDDSYSSQAVVNWEGGFDHCIEVYGLDATITTTDIQEFIDWALDQGVSDHLQPFIRWSDDEHLVLVCASVRQAGELLQLGSAHSLKMRPWAQASQVSKQLGVSKLLPPKPRPKTTAAVARKLLSHALGRPELRDKGAERELAQARAAQRERRKAARDNPAWEDE